MFTALKREWRTLSSALAGHRFQQAHRNRHDPDRPLWKRATSLAVALAVIAIGLVALPAPGPGTVVLILGFAMLGREIGFVARALDKLELVLRRVWRWIRRTWRNAGTLGRVGMAAVAALIGLAIAGVTALMAYRMIFN